MIVRSRAAKPFLLTTLIALLPSFPAHAGLCVVSESQTQRPESVSVAIGDELRLFFKHSIYGSDVEEIFAVRQEGLELIQLRYGEARLVDFYGYEQARREDGVWIVTPEPRMIRSLNLHVSDHAALKLVLHSVTGSYALKLPRDGALRVGLGECP